MELYTNNALEQKGAINVKNLEEMILPYVKRSKMRDTVNYTAMKAIWDKSELNDSQNYGDLGYLMRVCNEKFKKENHKNIKRAEWEEFYFSSGESRKGKTANIYGNIESNIYYGRTFDELVKLSESFYKEIENSGTAIKPNVKNVFNFVYAEIIDSTFRLYVRMSRINIALKNIYKDYIFELSSPSDYMNSGLDLFIYKDNIEKGAIKLLDNNSEKSSIDPLEIQQHEIFESINGIPVYYLTLNFNHEPIGKLPL